MKKIYPYLVIGILLIIPIGTFFYHTDMSRENRIGAGAPQLIRKGSLNTGFFDDFDQWFNDHYAFRQEMATVHNRLSALVFHSVPDSEVVVGKEGWLFFSQTLDDYFRRDLLSDRQIYDCARTLKLLEEGARQKGAGFLYFTAPDKNSLYPEYMPANYRPGEGQNNFERLREALQEEGVTFLDLHEAFRAEDRILYHKTDTHWTNEGAAFATGRVMEALGLDHIDYREEPYHLEYTHDSDLYRMLYPQGKERAAEILYDRGFDFSFSDAGASVEDFEVETTNPGKDGSLVMFRDSYGNAQLPFMAEEFGAALFSRAMPYDWDLLTERGADTVVIELVERHIPSLCENLPRMEAPEREELDQEVPVQKSGTSLEIREGSLPVIYGNLDPSAMDPDSPVYIRVVQGSSRRDFEAFPVTYHEVGLETTDPAQPGYGYALRLDTSTLDKGEAGLEVLVLNEGKLRSTGTIKTMNIQ